MFYIHQEPKHFIYIRNQNILDTLGTKKKSVSDERVTRVQKQTKTQPDQH